jgi:UrcA family protein
MGLVHATPAMGRQASATQVVPNEDEPMTLHLIARGLALVWIAAAFVASTPAAAQTASTTDAVRVRFADLDINHAAGAKVLLGRIAAAADRVCTGDVDTAILTRRTDFIACRTSVIQRTVMGLGVPMVIAVAGYADPKLVVAQR